MRAQKSANSLMDGGAYAPIVSRILKSGRWVGSDGRKVAQEQLEMKVGICGEKFPATWQPPLGICRLCGLNLLGHYFVGFHFYGYSSEGKTTRFESRCLGL